MPEEIQMPPQDVHGDEHFNDDALRLAIFQLASTRFNTWLTYVLTAIDEFETNAREHIAQLEYDHDASVNATPLVSAFTGVLGAAFPAGGLGLAAVTSIAGLVAAGLQSSWNSSLVVGLSGAKIKLEKSVASFTDAAREQVTKAFPSIDDNLSAHIDEWLTWVQWGSTDPNYVGAFCDWLGIVQPTPQTAVWPIRQALENAFFGIYQGVRAVLVEASEGDPDGSIFPAKWSREGRDAQEDMYKDRGPEAWDDAYDYDKY